MVLKEFAVLEYPLGTVMTWPKLFAAGEISNVTAKAWFGKYIVHTLSQSDQYCIHVKGHLGFYLRTECTTTRTLEGPYISKVVVPRFGSLCRLHAFGGGDGLTKSAC
jgi:hypothetical protein